MNDFILNVIYFRQKYLLTLLTSSYCTQYSLGYYNDDG